MVKGVQSIKYTKIFLLILLVVQLGLTLFSQNSVLVLNSYNPGLSWSDAELEGLNSVLSKQYELEVYVEYLDSKRFGDPYSLELFKDYLFKKFKNINLDAVIALDNDAFDFVLENYETFFKGIPVVFCGINYYKEYNLESKDFATGVVETQDIRDTLSTALSLHKDVKHVYVIIDNYTKTSILVRQEMGKEVIPYFPNINFIFLSDSLEEIHENLSNPVKNSIAILLGFNKDKNGIFYSFDQIGRFIEQFDKIPIYTTLSVYMDYNVIGGKITSAFDQGVKAGEIVLNILSGADIKNLPRYYLLENKYLFNYPQLVKFKISLNSLPSNSIVLNKPIPFYKKYPVLFWIGVVSIVFLIVINIVIINKNKKVNILLKKLKENEIELQNFAEELAAANEQLISSNEQLIAQNEELRESYENIALLRKKIDNLLVIISDIGNEEVPVEIFFQKFLNILISEVPEADYGSVSLIEGDEWKFLAAIGHDVSGLNSLELKREYAFFTQEVQVVENISSVNNGRMPEEIATSIKNYSKPIKSTIIKAIKIDEKRYLNISLDIREGSNKTFSLESINFFDNFINLAKVFLLNRLKSEEVRKAYIDFTNNLALIAESHDENSYMHIHRVSNLSAFLAEKYGLSEEEVEKIRIFSPLHDVGKLLIPSSILNKQEELTDEEWEEIKKHPLYAEHLLTGDYFETARRIALYHHEHYDGSGYPFGLKNDDIPIEAQIVGLVDIYDALRSKRSYKEPFTHEQSLEILLKGDTRTKPDHFNPKLLEIFKTYEKEIKEIYESFDKEEEWEERYQWSKKK